MENVIEILNKKIAELKEDTDQLEWHKQEHGFGYPKELYKKNISLLENAIEILKEYGWTPEEIEYLAPGYVCPHEPGNCGCGDQLNEITDPENEGICIDCNRKNKRSKNLTANNIYKEEIMKYPIRILENQLFILRDSVKISGRKEEKDVIAQLEKAIEILKNIPTGFDFAEYQKSIKALYKNQSKPYSIINTPNEMDVCKISDHTCISSSEEPESSAGYRCDICGKCFWSEHE